MTKDKQIEEMAKVMNECCNRYDEQGNHLGNKCFECECWCDTNHICCSYNRKEAEALYNAGYRKASEVAEEIFEEIDDLLYKDERDYDDLMESETVSEIYQEYLACSNYIYGTRKAIAKLKKKYTEEEK